MTSNKDKLKAFATEIYLAEFEPNNLEDEWYPYRDNGREVVVNIFRWEDAKPEVNVYKNDELIDAFILEV